MNTKHLGTIAVAHAISYFSSRGYFVFLPIGDNGGDIDMVVSVDGKTVERVQCKYASSRHSASQLRNPDNPVWQVNLRTVKSRANRNTKVSSIYTPESFDLLFVTTPDGDYLIHWSDLCPNGCVPTTVRIGKKLAHAKL